MRISEKQTWWRVVRSVVRKLFFVLRCVNIYTVNITNIFFYLTTLKELDQFQYYALLSHLSCKKTRIALFRSVQVILRFKLHANYPVIH